MYVCACIIYVCIPVGINVGNNPYAHMYVGKYAWFSLGIYIYMCMCIYIYVCVCVGRYS